MKNLIFAASILIALAVAASAQVNPAMSVANQPVTKPATKPEASRDPAKTTRARVLNQTQKSQATIPSGANDQPFQAHAKINFKNRARLESLSSPGSESTDTPVKTAASSANLPIHSVEKSTAVSAASVITNTTVALPNPVSSQIYRVGVGDVLDIQLDNNPLQGSTLFTVLGGGILEYPLVSSPLQVTGMTTAEIATALRQKIKLFEDPAVVVNVRDYASHTVNISGFVAAPGTKILRRETVPLYTVLAESLILPDAARVAIERSGNPIVVDLKDPNQAATLVLPGDVIKVLGAAPIPAEFYFVAGEVKLPGQKPYHSGLTLMQAILAAGGAKETASARVRVSRQGADGRLATQEFNLRKIQDGKIADPVLQKDDRIELPAAN